MNLEVEQIIQGTQFDQFDYRLLYFRPSPHSEEQIAVGVLADSVDRVEVRFVSSAPALMLMAEFLGEEAVEQFQFASGEFRRALSSSAKVADLEFPTDLFVAGESFVAYTKDRSGFLGSVLASSSALLRTGATSVAERVGATDSRFFSQEVMNEVSRLNPFLGDRIFHHRLNMDDGEILELPILGNKVFGAPVSFAARDHRMRAEAYVAKFHWARRRISQEPRLYVRAPTQGLFPSVERLERSLRELRSIAEAADIPVRICLSTEELASEIVRDEAA